MRPFKKFLFLYCFLSITTVHAATFTVNSLFDASDAAPGNGVCATTGGECTLRAAVEEANALAGADTINIPAGTYLLSVSALNITGPLSINGAGPDSTTLSGLYSKRIFNIAATAGEVSLGAMSIVQGANNPDGLDGGCIRSTSSQLLTLSNVKIKHCLASGAAGGGLAHYGPITITDSEISNSQANGSGGLYLVGTGNVSIDGTTISDNIALTLDSGGGEISRLSSVNVNITNSSISRNFAQNGQVGGILVSILGGSCKILNSEIVKNTASGQIGGLVVSIGSLNNTIEIKNSKIEDNQSITNSYGGFYLATNNGNIDLEGNSISNNKSASNVGGGLAQILNAPGEISLKNTTVKNNFAINNHGGIYFDGKSNIKITNTLFSDNATILSFSVGASTTSGGTVELSDSKIHNNYTNSLGAFAISLSGTAGALVDNSSFTNNTQGLAYSLYLAKTGTTGDINIRRSLFYKNTSQMGSAFGLGNAASSSSINIENNTFSENFNINIPAVVIQGNNVIRNNTFFKNKSQIAGAPTSLLASGASTNLTIVGNIFREDDSARPYCGTIGGGSVASGGNNIFDNSGTGCNINASLADLINTDAQLQPLANNGGPTLTHAIFPGSPAIDKFGAGCPATDQRGVARPQDGNGDGSSLCDAGAYENFDLCPSDPNKLVPGACGCGNVDVDTNRNGVFDCLAGADLKKQSLDLEALVAKLKYPSTTKAAKKQKQKKLKLAIKKALAALLAFANANAGSISTAPPNQLSALLTKVKKRINAVLKTYSRPFVPLKEFLKEKESARKSCIALAQAIIIV